jgi:AP-1 complex subunit beta-1
LAKYRPGDSKESDNICERIAPRLNHANSAVVLGAIRVLMIMVEYLANQDRAKEFCKKMAPPLGRVFVKPNSILFSDFINHKRI